MGPGPNAEQPLSPFGEVHWGREEKGEGKRKERREEKRKGREWEVGMGKIKRGCFAYDELGMNF